MGQRSAERIPEVAGQHLRAWRAQYGLTQRSAANMAGVQRVAWARWELGISRVPQWLCDVLRQRHGSAPDEVTIGNP